MPVSLLLIEDNEDILANLYAYLEPLGYELDCARHGRAGLDMAVRGCFDCIVLDIMLPGLDGVSLCRMLREEHRSAVPVLMLTARDTVADRVRGLEAGADDYLVKPFEFARFRQALDKFLQRQKLLSNSGGMDQRAIDQLLQSQDGEESAPQLSKGLNGATLRLIQDFLARSQGQALTSEEIAEQVHLSRITIRRYVNYMVETGELVSSIDYQTGGRPSIRYRYTGNFGAAGKGST